MPDTEHLIEEIRQAEVLARRTSRLSVVLRVLLCLALVLAGGLLLFWLYWPWHLLTNSGAVAVTPQDGSTGHLAYTITYCRNSPVPSTIYRTIQGVDGTHYTYSLPPVGSSVPNGCGVTTIPVNAGVPIHPGRYYIRVTISYPINPLRNITYQVNTNVFTVT